MASVRLVGLLSDQAGLPAHGGSSHIGPGTPGVRRTGAQRDIDEGLGDFRPRIHARKGRPGTGHGKLAAYALSQVSPLRSMAEW